MAHLNLYYGQLTEFKKSDELYSSWLSVEAGEEGPIYFTRLSEWSGKSHDS